MPGSQHLDFTLFHPGYNSRHVDGALEIMTNLSIRGLDDEATTQLKEDAKRHGKSINCHAKDLLQNALGRQVRGRQVDDDLDALAGTWTEEDALQFQAHLECMQQVDEALWR